MLMAMPDLERDFYTVGTGGGGAGCDAPSLPARAAIADNANSIAVSAASAIEIAGAMTIEHNDLFDRLLIAQAQVKDMALVSNEALFDRFMPRRLWQGSH